MNLLNGLSQMTEIKLHLNYAGYCLANAKHAVKGDINKLIKFKALYALIFHKKYGYILFDTGYTQRFFEATKKYPNKIYAIATKVKLLKSEEVKSQLEMNGISPDDIKHVIISHFHADHIGGLKDFAKANFYCTKKSYNQVKNISNFFAFSKGILLDLIPKDFEKKIKFIENIASKKDDKFLGTYYDFFGDNSIKVLNLPGHAVGQIGVILKTNKKKYFLVSDACWDIRAITENKLPNKIVKLFFDSWDDYVSSVERIKKIKMNFPDLVLVPTHCSKTTDNLVSDQIDFHAL